MRRERYRFFRQIGGRGAHGDVEVSAVVAGARHVTVASTAFAWLEDAYGPDAQEGPGYDEHREAAIAGVHFALDHACPLVDAVVVIECIRVSPADASAESIAYAAAWATWRALALRPTKLLAIYGVELPD
jgi:hypothetical protein